MELKIAVNKFIEWRKLKVNPSRSTISGYVTHLTQFCVYIGDLNRDVESISFEECVNFLQIWRDLGIHQNTLQKKAISVKKFLEFLQMMDLQVVKPEMIPIPQKVFTFPRVADEDQYRKLLSVIPERGTHGPRAWDLRNKAIIMLLWDTGARNGEICSIDIDNINLESMSATIYTEKSRGTIPFRQIFWCSETNEVLKKWVKRREELSKEMEFDEPKALFVGVKGGGRLYQAKGKRIKQGYVGEILRKYSNKAKLGDPLKAHDCRHRMGRELAQKDANAHGISSILGHAQVSSSYPYTMLFGKDRENFYREKMGR